jgi:hypothetical protein
LSILIATNGLVQAWLPPIPDRLVLLTPGGIRVFRCRPLLHHFTRRSRGSGERGEMDPIDWITGSTIDSAMRIHSALGPGRFKSVYEGVLECDRVGRGLRVERQKAIGS